MTTYILNGFSFLMNQPDEGNIKYKYVSSEDAREMCINATSRVGQKNLAKVLSNEFGFQVDYCPGNIELEEGDDVIVAYLAGNKLPEGATKLPRNVDIKYVHAKLKEAVV
mgnify:CR=1 FL=1